MRLRRVLLAAAAVLLLAAAALVVVPGLLDWNRYRDTIEALATAGIGRPVRIEGDVTFQLLPQPVLTAARTTVADGGDGVALSARALRLRVGLPALLAGRIDARELTLRGAELRLPWPPAPGSMALRPPPWLSGLQARVEEGRIQIGGLALTDIEGTLSTDRDTGSLSAAGSGQFAGRTWHVTARLGRSGADGVAPLEASLDGQGAVRDTGGSFSGQLAPDGTLTGRVTGRGRDLSLLLPAPPVPWQAEGRLLASGGLAVADDLALTIGNSPARGAIALRVAPDARLDVAVAASQLDLDAWLPVLLRGARAGLPTSLDLSAEAASLGGGTLRRLRGAFDMGAPEGAAAIAVRDASATLPGDAQLSLSGRILPSPRPETGPRFEGTARLAAPDLRGTLAWLAPLAPGPIGALPPGTLRTAQIQGTVALEPGQVTVSELRGQLDGAALTGWAHASIGPGSGPGNGTASGTAVGPGSAPAKRLQLRTRLAVDRLVLDPWLPNPAALLPQAGPLPARSFDVELALDAKRATWRGAALTNLSLDAEAATTGISLRRLEFEAFGAHLGATGTLQDIGRIADGRLDLTTAQLAPVQPLLPGDWQRLAGLLTGPAVVQVLASGPADALALRLGVELGDLRLDVQPTVNLPARRVAGTVTLRHPGAPRLLETLGLTGVAAWLGDGSLSVLAQLDVQPGRVSAESFDISAGFLRGTGQLTLQNEAGRGPAVTGKVSTELLPLPFPYPRSPAPLPFAALRGWRGTVRVEAGRVLAGLTPVLDDAAANLSLENGTLQVSDLTARLAGGTLAGSAALDVAADPPRAAVQASVSGVTVAAPLFDLPFDLAAGRIQGGMELSAAGYSPAALLATLAGTLRGTVRDGAATGFDLAGIGAALGSGGTAREADAALRAALAGGATPFGELAVAGRVARGTIQLDGTALSGPAGRVAVQGLVDLPGGGLDLDLALDPAAPAETVPQAGPRTDLPGVGLRITGAAEAPRRTPELARAARWLAERPR